jgi:CBS domain-containing protein
MVTRKDIYESLMKGGEDIRIEEIMTSEITVCFPHEDLKTVLQKMGEKDIGRIPVVEEGTPQSLIGLITRENIIAAYHDALKDQETESRHVYR